ncbi:MAG TPA: type IV pilus secretin PilQ [Gammaproteobacteria bacterium]|nr:type IV pilus secretin PilQ [Gammaproteobacteria bacterium]
MLAGQTAALAANGAPLALEKISHSTLPGDRVQIKLQLSGPAPKPLSFSIDKPARIALDFANTVSKLPSRTVSVGAGVARSVTAVEAGGRTRVVINLANPVSYETNVEGDAVYVTLESGAGDQAQARAASKAGSSRVGAAGTAGSVQSIDFRRGAKGEGRILVKLSDPSVPVDMKKRGNNIVVSFQNSSLPDELERRLDVKDFATPVQTVDTYSEGNNVKMVIAATGDFDDIAYQTDNQFTVEVKPVPKETKEAAKTKKKKYTGERLSLNFQNIEVRAVLQLLADFTGLNMVTSDSVKGSLTLRLKNVPWDQALDIILKSKGLGMRRDGNVIMVAPAEQIAAREKLELQAAKQVEELAPLRSESIQINYAKAADIAKLLKAKGNSLLSKRGNITVDDRTNKLLIQDTAENLDAMRALVSELDVPVRQVLIESRIVLATNQFSKELGVRFGVTKETPAGGTANGTTYNLSGNNVATTQMINGDTITAPDRLNVNLPVTNLGSTAGTIGLAVTKLPFGTLLELELSAAQAEGRTEIISSPRVITANQKEATIEQGAEIPYQQATSSGATSVAFKKAVLSLKVTPQITPDDRVIMDLKVNKDSPDFANAVQGTPPINTQNLTTQVLVNNGETVVLGGVYEQTKSHQINRVPFFGDLPIVGFLFRNKYVQDNKSELLIFVTPKIVKEGLQIQ